MDLKNVETKKNFLLLVQLLYLRYQGLMFQIFQHHNLKLESFYYYPEFHLVNAGIWKNVNSTACNYDQSALVGDDSC